MKNIQCFGLGGPLLLIILSQTGYRIIARAVLRQRHSPGLSDERVLIVSAGGIIDQVWIDLPLFAGARIRYDLEYIRNWSIFSDWRILFLTIKIVLNTKDIY